MPTVVDQARGITPLQLRNEEPALFTGDGDKPATVTLPGGTNLDLSLFEVTATGIAKPEAPGMLTLTLYGRAALDGATTDPAAWLPLSSAPAEPIGGPDDPTEAMFMIQAADLLAYPGSGKLQGVFKSNVASNPQGPADLMEHPGDLTEADPIYVFAVGASFSPQDSAPESESGKTGRAAEEPVLCTVTLASFTLSA